MSILKRKHSDWFYSQILQIPFREFRLRNFEYVQSKSSLFFVDLVFGRGTFYLNDETKKIPLLLEKKGSLSIFVQYSVLQ